MAALGSEEGKAGEECGVALHFGAEDSGGSDSVVSAFDGQGFGTLKSQGAHIGELVVLLIATALLAAHDDVAFDVEHVVLHLKSKAEQLTITAGIVDQVKAIDGHGGEGGGGGEESSGLAPVHLTQRRL